MSHRLFVALAALLVVFGLSSSALASGKPHVKHHVKKLKKEKKQHPHHHLKGR
jgi:hypothetical protein